MIKQKELTQEEINEKIIKILGTQIKINRLTFIMLLLLFGMNLFLMIFLIAGLK
jgi:hypothetical protein